MASPLARRCLALAIAALAGPSLRAQFSTADTLLGSVVRVRITRASSAGEVRPRSASGEGLLIRRRGNRQRVDMLKGIEDTTGEDWITSTDSLNVLAVHSGRERRTLVMRFDDLRQVFTSLLQARFDSVSTEAELLGRGPVLLGHATQRVRFVRRFRMQTSRAGKTQVIRMHSESDVLVAPDVPESYGSNSALSITSGNTGPLIERIFGPGSSRVMVRGGGTVPAGLALRTVTRSRTETSGESIFPLGSEASGVTVDSVEVLSITRAPVPDTVLDPPSAFSTLDFGGELRKLVAMIDELAAAMQGKGTKSPKPFAKPTAKPAKP